MGKLKDGIFGGFSGKVGNVVGSSWKGIEYVKSRPVKMTNPRTKGQIKQRNKFIDTQKFLGTFTPMIRIGFKEVAGEEMSAFNAAMSYNMVNGIKIVADDSELDFPNILVSKGPLFPATDIKVTVIGSDLHFEWNPTPAENSKPDDQVMILAYNPSKVEAVYDINASKRSGSSTGIILPDNWIGDFIETYIAFKSADGSVVSDSIYTGRLEI